MRSMVSSLALARLEGSTTGTVAKRLRGPQACGTGRCGHEQPRCSSALRTPVIGTSTPFSAMLATNDFAYRGVVADVVVFEGTVNLSQPNWPM
jgi:hypothetical protein